MALPLATRASDKATAIEMHHSSLTRRRPRLGVSVGVLLLDAALLHDLAHARHDSFAQRLDHALVRGGPVFLRDGLGLEQSAKYAAKRSELSSLDYVPYLEHAPEGRCWGLTRERLVPRCRRRYAGPLSEPEIRRAQKIGEAVFERPHAQGFVCFTPRSEILFNEICGEEAGYLDDQAEVE